MLKIVGSRVLIFLFGMRKERPILDKSVEPLTKCGLFYDTHLHRL